jgi:aspartate/methionine/tyrosine aminotransferase/SAM-dependent methyltransferase
MEFRELLELPSRIPLVARINNGELASYGEIAGTFELRSEICRYEENRSTVSDINPDDIIITHGATQAISAVFEWHRRYLSGNIYLPVPGYPNYWEQSAEHGKRVTTYSLDHLTPGHEYNLLNKMRAGDLLVVNSPHNPTGQIVSLESFNLILSAALRGGWFILFDAVYDELRTIPPYRVNLSSDESIIYVNSISKSLGAADLRIGWFVAPTPIRAILLRILESQSVAVSRVSQTRALSVITNSSHDERARNREMIRRQSAFCEWLFNRLTGLEFIGSGGPYGLAKIPSDLKVSKICSLLIKNYNSVLIPGEYFHAAEDTCRIPLSMSFTEARRTARYLQKAIESARIDKLPLIIADLCSKHSLLFLRVCRVGLLAQLEQARGTIKIRCLIDASGLQSHTELVDELCDTFHQLGWLRYKSRKTSIKLTKVGRAAIAYLYYHWLIHGAYKEVLADPINGKRELAEVGLASCQMSRFGAFPLLLKLLDQLNLLSPTILDVGCGSGEGTIEMAISSPQSHVIGFDMCKQSIDRARHLASRNGLTNRVSFHRAEALDCLPTEMPTSNVVPIFAFILHELVGQEGVESVIEYLKKVLRTYPKSFVLIVEPDIQERESMRDIGPDALAFFDFYWIFYYHIHEVTQQKLLPSSSWKEIFYAAGYDVVKVEAIPPIVDPCRIELVYVLAPRRISNDS